MSLGFATRQNFAVLNLETPREIRPTEQPPIVPQKATVPRKTWTTRDEVIRIVTRIRAQLSRTARVLMFTGITQDNGASGLAWEVALALSKLETDRILLIDTDIGAPALHQRLEIPSSPGLAEAIAADGFREAVQTVIEGRLHVLPAGNTLLSPAALFSSPELAPMMQVLRSDYRYVVLSTPPVLADVSASLLSPYVDGVVLAVATGAQRRAELRAAQQELYSLNAKVVGVVLCDTDGLQVGEP